MRIWDTCGNFKMADAVSKKCLKILCLHGYRQNAKVCREKLGAFRKAVKKLPLEFVYITAPNNIPKTVSGEIANPEENEEYGWWFSTSDDEYNPLAPTEINKGFDSSLVLVTKTFEEQGPFDGIFGFSQGASLLSILCAMRDQGIFKFDFAIMVASFKSRSSAHKVYYEKPITCPTLHVYGDTDKVIPKENSEELAKLFINSDILNHPGGHFVPAASAQKKVYLDFIERFLSPVNE